MKQFLAYALLLIGIPFYLGLLGGVIFAPLAWAFNYPARITVVHLFKIPTGIITIIIARYMFYVLGVSSNWSVLIISSIWISLYYSSYQQLKFPLICYLLGLVIGWYISPV